MMRRFVALILVTVFLASLTYAPIISLCYDPQAVHKTDFTQNSGIMVGTGTSAFQEETGATLRTSIGVGTGDSPTFASVFVSDDGTTGTLTHFWNYDDTSGYIWNNTANIGFGTDTPAYKLSIGSADGSDQIGIYHDNDHAYMKWTKGVLNLITDEGTNANSILSIKGKGNLRGYLRIYDENDGEYFEMYAASGKGYIRTAGASPQALGFQAAANVPITMFVNAPNNKTPELQIYGYRDGDEKRYAYFSMGKDANDTLSIGGVGNYYFDGNVGIGAITPGARTESRAVDCGAPVTSGNVQTYGSLRLRGDETNVIDFGSYANPTLAGWIQVGEAANLAINYNLALQPNGGNVGIGTAEPNENLEISEDLGDDEYGGLRISNSDWTAMGRPMIDFFNSHPSANFSSARIFSEIGSNGTNSKLYFAVDDGSKETLENRMVIDKDGNVGIGINSPGRLLDVASIAPVIRISDTDANSVTKTVGFLEFGFTTGGWDRSGWIGYGSSTNDVLTINNEDGSNIALIGADVGIGTTSPDAKFQVIGDCIFGDDVNDLLISPKGQLTLVGDARVKKYLNIGPGSLVRGTSPPGEDIIGTYPVFDFASNLTETAYYTFHIPPEWVVGTDIEIAIYWCPTTNDAGKIVSWEIDWEAVARGDGAAGEIVGAGSTNAPIHDTTYAGINNLQETPYAHIAGASLAVDDTIGICVTRDHDDEDDYGADAALVHIEIEIVIDRLGEPI